jgi:homoserine dehydrogenase
LHHNKGSSKLPSEAACGVVAAHFIAGLEKKYGIKLIARAVKQNGKIFALVAPQFIEEHDSLANIRNEYNAVQVEGAFSEKQLFVGKGAGSYPTGSAVLSDVSALSYDYHYEYKKLKQVHDTRFTNAFSVEVFVSFKAGTEISIQDFETFTSGYASGDKQYMVGTATLENLQKWSKLEGVGIILAPNSEITAHSKVAEAALAF